MEFYNIKATDFNALIKILSKNFMKKGWVKETFYSSIIEREKKYPTGLLLKDGATVAIPHTDPEHVNVDKIIPIQVTRNIEMIKMATTNEKINTNKFFILLVKDKDGHATKLASVITLFQEKSFIKLLKNNSEKNFVKIKNKIEKITNDN